MSELSEQPVSCPYCGEDITILVDQSLSDQEYVEDCQVCCRPIVLRVSVETDGHVAVRARSEAE
jgi:Cysteine-rich CPXCG